MRFSWRTSPMRAAVEHVLPNDRCVRCAARSIAPGRRLLSRSRAPRRKSLPQNRKCHSGLAPSQVTAWQRVAVCDSVPVPLCERSILLVRQNGDRHLALRRNPQGNRAYWRGASPRFDSRHERSGLVLRHRFILGCSCHFHVVSSVAQDMGWPRLGRARLLPSRTRTDKLPVPPAIMPTRRE